MVIFLGILLIIIGVLLSRWIATIFRMSPMSRPMVFYSSMSIVLSFFLGVLLLGAGFFLIFRTSFIFGLILLIIIVLLFLISKRESSINSTKNAMYKTYRIVKNAYKDFNLNEMDDKEKAEHEKNILFLTLEPRYRYIGKYDSEALKSIIDEYPDIESLTSFVILFEFFEELYPSMGIEPLRRLASDALQKIKETESGLFVNIENYIKDYRKILRSF